MDDRNAEIWIKNDLIDIETRRYILDHCPFCDLNYLDTKTKPGDNCPCGNPRTHYELMIQGYNQRLIEFNNHKRELENVKSTSQLTLLPDKLIGEITVVTIDDFQDKKRSIEERIDKWQFVVKAFDALLDTMGPKHPERSAAVLYRKHFSGLLRGAQNELAKMTPPLTQVQ